MLTWLSRSRCGLVYGSLLVACSVDSRTLAFESHEDPDSAGGRTPDESSLTDPSNVANAGSANDDASVPNAGDTPNNPGVSGGDSAEPSSSTCSGAVPERRCAVAGGSFQLNPGEAPVASNVASFELDELEVTVERFRKYVTHFPGAPAPDAGAHPALAHSGWRSEWTSFFPETKAGLLESLHCNADWETWTDAPADRENYPLTCASYYVAFAFCVWRGGRLPTEAEWEYAASGGAQQRRYPWGNEEPSFELALFDTSSIAPAGGHRAGMARFGQLDLAGSAWEWTLDYFRDYPAECDQCAELQRGSERVLRGGAFLYGAEYLKPSYRYPMDPQLSLGDVGFRCAYGP